jgi:N-methylhydantoinase A
MYRLSIDMGGTFTDFSLVDDKGNLTEAKSPSSRDVASVMKTGVEVLSQKLGITSEILYQSTTLLVHGTTVAINALLQHKGSPVGLICTEGFRDSLEIRLGWRDKRYDFTWTMPSPLVPRRLRLPVRERVNKEGRITIPLEEDDVYRAIETFRANDITNVGVCFLWSFLNPVHEQRVHDILRQEMPDAHLTISSQVCPEIREYDRVSTVAINAFILESLSSHLNSFETYFRNAGYKGEIRYLQSSGGIVGADAIRSNAVSALHSGPAAGPASGRFFGTSLGFRDIITIDMGGTSFDAAVLPGGRPEMRSVTEIGGRHRVRVPTIDVQAIGAGGGSIAWVDRGILRVGPQSAEANPGPACYNNGGTEPTVTDADVVLGYLNPGAQLGGVLQMNAKLAHDAIAQRVAEPLGVSVLEAATGIVNMVNENMTDIIERITLQKGYDPRDYALVVGGGAGPVHAGSLAEALGVSRVIVPKVAGEFCSFGGLISDLRHDYRRSCASQLQALDLNWVQRLIDEMEQEGRNELHKEGANPDDIIVTKVLDMRYKGQLYEIPVDISDFNLATESDQEVDARFHRTYHERYQFSQPGHIVEVINARVSVVGKTSPVDLKPIQNAKSDISNAQTGTRLALFLNFKQQVEIPIYDGSALQAGHIINGPAVIEEPHTTIVVFPKWQLEVQSVPSYMMTYIG